MKNVMTTEHPGWHQFVLTLDKLLRERGCDNTHRFSMTILSETSGIDATSSLEWLRNNGGCCCDCEVLMNIEGRRIELAIMRGEEPVPEWWDDKMLQGMKGMYGIVEH